MQATLKKLSYLENFPAYMWNIATGNCNEHLSELNQTNYFKSYERPQYSASMFGMPYIYVTCHSK